MQQSTIHQLLIIDPQNDFCDLPVSWCPPNPLKAGELITPALPVNGAHGDMQRLAHFVRQASDAFHRICVTLDSHHRLDIAHPSFWQQGQGGAVQPFTTITATQVRAQQFQPRDPAALPRALAYLDELEARGRYTLMVWPVHCEIGTWGHAIHADLKNALSQWEDVYLRSVHIVTKGENPWTEHYSAMQAEVPDPEDKHTQLNTDLIAKLDQADVLIIGGEASSHCVRATTEHIVQNLPSRNAQKVILLTDCMSAVGGFEAQQKTFWDDMQSKGVRLMTHLEALSVIQNR